MDTTRYNSGARAFHWTIAGLVIFNFASGLLNDALEQTFNVIPLHKSVGLTVLVLSIGRLGWRLAWTRPPYPASLSTLEARLASIVHGLFYILMLAMPLSGWIFSSAGKYPLSWFGLFDWPKLAMTRDMPLVGASREFHEIGGWIFLALVVLHVGAALRHHFVLRDGVLKRMV